jgi:hypothetical protein
LPGAETTLESEQDSSPAPLPPSDHIEHLSFLDGLTLLSRAALANFEQDAASAAELNSQLGDGTALQQLEEALFEGEEAGEQREALEEDVDVSTIQMKKTSRQLLTAISEKYKTRYASSLGEVKSHLLTNETSFGFGQIMLPSRLVDPGSRQTLPDSTSVTSFFGIATTCLELRTATSAQLAKIS